MPKPLHLVLTRYWYEEIRSGRKNIEYRRPTPFWRKRIWDKRDTLKTVVFHRGYTNQNLTRAIEKIDIGPCEYPDWKGQFIRIHLAEPATQV